MAIKDSFGRIKDVTLTAEQMRSLLMSDVKASENTKKMDSPEAKEEKDRQKALKNQDKIIDLLKKITKEDIKSEIEKLAKTVDKIGDAAKEFYDREKKRDKIETVKLHRPDVVQLGKVISDALKTNTINSPVIKPLPDRIPQLIKEIRTIGHTITSGLSRLEKTILRSIDSTKRPEKAAKKDDNRKTQKSIEETARSMSSLSRAGLKKGSIYTHDEGTHILLSAIIKKSSYIPDLRNLPKPSELKNLLKRMAKGSGKDCIEICNFDELVDVLKKRKTGTSSGMGEVEDTIAEGVEKATKGATTQAKKAVADELEDWGDYFSRVIGPIGEGMAESWKALSGKVAKIGRGFVFLWDKLGGRREIQGFLNAIESAKLIGEVVLEIGSFVKFGIGKFFTKVIPDFFTKSIPSWGATAGATITGVLKDFFYSLAPQKDAGIMKAWNKITEAFSAVKMVGSFLGGVAWNSLADGVKWAAGRLSWIGSLFGVVGEKIGAVGAKIGGWGSWIGKQIGDIARPFTSGVGSSIRALFGGRRKKPGKGSGGTPDVTEATAEATEGGEGTGAGGGKKKRKRGGKAAAGSTDLCACICECISAQTKELVAALGKITAVGGKGSIWGSISKFFSDVMSKISGMFSLGGGKKGGGMGGGRSLYSPNYFLSQLGSALLTSNKPVQDTLERWNLGETFHRIAKYIPLIGPTIGNYLGTVINTMQRPMVQQLSYQQDTAQLAFETEGINRGTGNQAGLAEQEAAMKAYQVGLREVYLTGQSIDEIQKQHIKNWRRGIREAGTLNKVTVAGLNTAKMIGASTEATSELFADMHQNLRMSAMDLANMGRGMQEVARSTGVTGDNLIKVARSSEVFMKNMQMSGRLTSGAGRNITGLLAEATTTGTTEGMNKLLQGLSSNLLNMEGDEKTRNLLIAAGGGNPMLRDKLLSGTLLQDRAATRQFAGGLRGVYNTATGGRRIEDMGAMERAAADATVRNTYGLGLNELNLLVQNFERASRSFAERYTELKGARPGMGRTQAQIDEQKRAMAFDQTMSYLTDFNTALEQATNRGEDMSSAMRRFNSTVSVDFAKDLQAMGLSAGTGGKADTKTMSSLLMRAVEDVNTRLRTAGVGEEKIAAVGGRIGGADIQRAMAGGPEGVQQLLGRLTALSQAAAKEAKKRQDPISNIEDSVKEIQAMVASITGLLTKWLAPMADSIANGLSSFATEGNKFIKAVSEGNSEELEKMGMQAAAWVKNVVEKFVKWLGKAFTTLPSIIENMLKNLDGTAFAKPIRRIWEAIKPGIEGIAAVFTNLGKVLDGTGGSKELGEAILGLLKATFVFVAMKVGGLGLILLGGLGDMLQDLGKEISGPLGGLVTSLGKVLSGVGDVIGGLIQTVTSLLSGDLAGAGAGLKTTFEGLIGVLFNAVYGVAQLVMIIGDFVSGIGTTMGEFGFLGEVIGSYVRSIGIAFSGVGQVLQGILDFIKALATWDVTAMGDSIKTVLSGLGDILLGAIEIALDATIDFLIGLPFMVIVAVGKAGKALVAGFLALFSKDTWVSMAKGIQNFFTNYDWSSIWKSFIDSVGGLAKRLVDRVVGWFQWMYDELVGASIIPDLVKAIAWWFATLPVRVFAALADLGKEIMRGIAGGLGNLGEIFSGTALGDMFDHLSDVFSTIGDALEGVSDVVMGLINWDWDRVFGGFQKIGDAMMSLPGKILDALASFAQSVMEALAPIGTWLLEKWDEWIKAPLQSVGSWFMTNVIDPIRDLGTIVGDALSSIRNFFADIGKNIWSWIERNMPDVAAIGTNIKNSVGAMFDDVKQRFGDAVNVALGFVNDLPSKITKGIRNAFNFSLAWIRDAIEGMLWAVVKDIPDPGFTMPKALGGKEVRIPIGTSLRSIITGAEPGTAQYDAFASGQHKKAYRTERDAEEAAERAAERRRREEETKNNWDMYKRLARMSEQEQRTPDAMNAKRVVARNIYESVQEGDRGNINKLGPVLGNIFNKMNWSTILGSETMAGLASMPTFAAAQQSWTSREEVLLVQLQQAVRQGDHALWLATLEQIQIGRSSLEQLKKEDAFKKSGSAASFMEALNRGTKGKDAWGTRWWSDPRYQGENRLMLEATDRMIGDTTFNNLAGRMSMIDSQLQSVMSASPDQRAAAVAVQRTALQQAIGASQTPEERMQAWTKLALFDQIVKLLELNKDSAKAADQSAGFLSMLMEAALREGSIYTHDVHLYEAITSSIAALEAMLATKEESRKIEMQPILRKLLGPKDPEEDVQRRRLVEAIANPPPHEVVSEELENIDDNTAESKMLLKKAVDALEAIKKLLAPSRKTRRGPQQSNEDVYEDPFYNSTLGTEWEMAQYTDTLGVDIDIDRT